MRRNISQPAALIAMGAFLALPALAQKVKQFKPGFNLFSPAQDIQIGKEGAAEVERTMQVVKNPELTNYINRIGERLAKSKRAGQFPFTFQVVNDPSINAFALPGGPMFIHTGLIAAVDNESELAGVMAHEMSHVALRHGTHQASKANLIQLPAMLAGGILGQGSIWSQLGQLGIGLGAQSVLLKYSRDAEKEADLNGAQIMNDAGYDPEQMARLFQKLEEQGQRDNSKLATFLSDHPTPGNRVQYIREQDRYLPKVTYSELSPQDLAKAKQIVAALPPPPKSGTAAGNSANGASRPRPSGQYKQFQGRAFSFDYPDNWETLGEPNSAMMTVAPRSGIVQDSRGQSAIGYGMIVSYWIPEGRSTDLKRDTSALIAQLQKQSPGLERSTEPQSAITVAGQRGLLTPLQSPSPFQGESELDYLVTVSRPEGLFYLIFITPKSEWQMASSKVFDHIVGSIKFPN
jgi:Zn-dependent protease with chaperone function